MLSYFRDVLVKMGLRTIDNDIESLLEANKIEVSMENVQRVNDFLTETQLYLSNKVDLMEDQLQTQVLFDELSYNFCLACMTFQCV